jgi:hypothetical protein
MQYLLTLDMASSKQMNIHKTLPELVNTTTTNGTDESFCKELYSFQLTEKTGFC